MAKHSTVVPLRERVPGTMTVEFCVPIPTVEISTAFVYEMNELEFDELIPLIFHCTDTVSRVPTCDTEHR